MLNAEEKNISFLIKFGQTKKHVFIRPKESNNKDLLFINLLTDFTTRDSQ